MNSREQRSTLSDVLSVLFFVCGAGLGLWVMYALIADRVYHHVGCFNALRALMYLFCGRFCGAAGTLVFEALRAVALRLCGNVTKA